MKKVVLIILSLLFLYCTMYGQSRSSYVQKIIHPDSCLVTLDSLLFDPETFVIKPDIPYRIAGNKIQFICDSVNLWKNQSFLVSYRTLQIDLHIPRFFLDTNQLVEREKAIYIGYDYRPYQSQESGRLISSSALNYNGSISRGFSVGNSQSLVLNSNLNLQLNGDLGNGIRVVAAISDDNIPIQANGNTQLLQEFDKVFMRVSKGRSDVTAGDFDLRSSSNSYFLNYFKKLQGLRFDNKMSTGKNSYLTSNANFAISRGKFARQTIEVKEGNQGPYKLQGNNGERFIIVLQGSEKVYYDGILLTRGQDYDYVIDYNNAEIIFTPRRLIRRESRIIIEYEYTDQNYLRSLYALNTQWQHDKYSFRLHFYNEQDSKNATGQIELDSTDIAILTAANSDPFSLVRSGIREIDPQRTTSNTILYKQTIDPETGDSILEYTRQIEPGVVSVFFSEVRLGQGSYVIDNESGANGRVYKYVGRGQGNYLPVIQLVAPEQRQMLNMGSEVKLSSRATFSGEASLSNFDENRFSTTDNKQNQGLATALTFSYLTPDSASVMWKKNISFNYEFLHENFQFLNPFRNQEFSRDWNIAMLDKTREQLVKANLLIKRSKNLSVGYDFNMYDRMDQYRGYRHKPVLNYKNKHTVFSFTADLLDSESNTEVTTFIRPTIDVKQSFPFLKNWSVRLKYLGEKNERETVDTEQLLTSSFAFDEYYIYVNSPSNDRKSLSLFGKRRIDKLASRNILTTAATVDEAGVEGKFTTDNTALQWNLTYRDFRVQEASLVNEQNTSTLLGRINYNLEAWNGMINSSTSVNVGSGQEVRREFQFVKVERGEGNYIYLGDLNNDGEDQINEYEVAVFSDQAEYIRVNVVNNEFIRTENQGINQSFRITPDKVLRNKKGWLPKTIGKISTNSIFRIEQKRMSEGSGGGLSFLDFDPGDTATVSYNSIINNIIFFNRGNPLYDFQIGNRRTSNRFVQITGYEQRNNNRFFFKSRFNPKRFIDVLTNIEIGNQYYDSELFNNKDLDADFLILNPSLVYRPSSNVRFSMEYAYDHRQQQINEKEESISNEVKFETTWRQAATSSLTGSLSIVEVDYTGLINTPVAYNILSGLNNGSNYLWSLNFTRRLSGNVDLSVTYDGRKTGEAPTVHIARAQVRANF